MAYMSELQRFIILYLSGKGSKCASVYEIMDAVKSKGVSRAKTPNAFRVSIIKALSRLARKGFIRRGWIRDRKGKKVRNYCLRGVE